MGGIQKNVNVSKEMKPLWGSKTIEKEYGLLGEMHRKFEKYGIENADKSKKKRLRMRFSNTQEYKDMPTIHDEDENDRSMYRKLSAVYSVLNAINKTGTVVTADMISENTYKTVKEQYGISTKDLKRLVNDAQQGRVPDFFITDTNHQTIDTAEKFVIKGKGDKRDLTQEEKKQQLLNLMYREYEVLKKKAKEELDAATLDREKKEKAYNDAVKNEGEKELQATGEEMQEKKNAYNDAVKNEEEKNNKYKELKGEEEGLRQYSAGDNIKLERITEIAEGNFSKKYRDEWKKSIEKQVDYKRNYVSVTMNAELRGIAKISSGEFTKTFAYKIMHGSDKKMQDAAKSLKKLLGEKRKEAGKSIKSFQMITLNENEIEEFGKNYGISKKDLLKLSTEIQSGKTKEIKGLG